MALVASMSISLEVVAEPRDDAMRERHWKQLMVVCKQTFIMDDKLQLDALLKLELDKFRDPVGEIVERARAEIKIDLQLQKIIKTWSGLFLFYKPYKTSGVQVLEQPGDVFEALDDNEVVLQNMMGNRFVGFFETTVTSWKAKLAATRSTLDVWLEVSRSRMQLESIFLASEDIGEQLPEDSKRFDALDAAFREQMTVACQNNDPIEVCMPSGREEVFKKNNPIEVCMASGREEVFKKNFEMLEPCQNSQGDYLEVKKKKFPRFYFISGADPRAVMRPMCSRISPSSPTRTASLNWAPDADGKLTALARGCIAIDDEKFPYQVLPRNRSGCVRTTACRPSRRGALRATTRSSAATPTLRSCAATRERRRSCISEDVSRAGCSSARRPRSPSDGCLRPFRLVRHALSSAPEGRAPAAGTVPPSTRTML